ncbi:MAG: glycosyltransferase family 39 protein [Pirellulales bacterium]
MTDQRQGPWREVAKHYALLIIIAGVVLFTNLGGPRLWDRDEPRNAGCALEMRARGDWVVPVFNNELRDAKPVLLYWFIMLAYELFGVTEFAARFWSAVFALGTVVATYHIARRLFDPSIALWSSLILSTTLMFDVAARAATPDSLLIFFSTASLLVYVMGTFCPPDANRSPAACLRTAGRYFPSDGRYVIGMYALMGFGILTKGPVGFLLPTAVIGMFMLIVRLPATEAAGDPAHRWQGRLIRLLHWAARPFAPLHFLKTCYSMRLVTATVVAVVIALPWYVQVGWRTDGVWLQSFFAEENFGRALRPMENHGGPPFYYLLAIGIGFLPWSILLIPAFIGAVSRVRRADMRTLAYLFLLCWVGVYVGLFTLARTKLPSYVTPTYPALAMLSSAFLVNWVRGEAVASVRWLRAGLTALVVVGPVALIAVFFAAQRFLPGDQWLGAIFLIITAGAAFALVQVKRDRRYSVALTMAVTSAVFCTSLFGFASLRVDRHQQIHVLIQAIQRQGEGVSVGSFGALEPSFVYYSGRSIVKLTRRRSAKDASPVRGASADWTPGGEPVSRMDVRMFLDQNPRAVVVTHDRYFRQLQDEFPDDLRILAEIPCFLKKHQLLLLGRESSTRTATSDLLDRKR